MDVTTVTDDSAVLHEGTTLHRVDGLTADTDHERFGVELPHAATPAG